MASSACKGSTIPPSISVRKLQIGNITPKHSSDRRLTQGSFHLHPKLTRFGFETNTPTDWSDFHTLVSVDFYGYTAGGDAGQALGNYSFGVVSSMAMPRSATC